MSSQELEMKYKEYQSKYNEYKSQRIAYITRMNDIVARTNALEKSVWDIIDDLSAEAMEAIQDKLPPKEEVTIDNLLAHKEAWEECAKALESYGISLLQEI